VYPEPLGDRQDTLAALPSGSNSFYFLLRQRGSSTSTRVLDDVETLIEHERRRRLEGRRSLDPRGIKAIQSTHEVQLGYPRYHQFASTKSRSATGPAVCRPFSYPALGCGGVNVESVTHLVRHRLHDE